MMGDPMVVSQFASGCEHAATVVTSAVTAQAPSRTWVIWATPCPIINLVCCSDPIGNFIPLIQSKLSVVTSHTADPFVF